MSNTYTQLHIHFVFAVKNRQSTISQEWKIELYKYISGIVSNKKHKLICINGMPDHIHILIGINPEQAISELVKEIKRSSTVWINETKSPKFKFEWQSGYGAFSYSKSQLTNVIDYINNQEEHHKKRTFREEYIEFLEKFEVEFNPAYIFKELQ